MLLNDSQISALAVLKENPLIEPFSPVIVREENGNKIASYGLGSFGYDIRLGNEFARPLGQEKIVSPHYPPEYEQWIAPSIIIGPGNMVLGVSMEKFTIPDDVIGIVEGKSTYARLGLIINCTPLEPGWSGYYTMALVNPTKNSIQVRAYEGIAQVMFFQGETPFVSYAKRAGKYQDATGVVTPRL